MSGRIDVVSMLRILGVNIINNKVFTQYSSRLSPSHILN